MISWVLSIVGFSAATVMFLLVRAKDKKIKSLSGKLASISHNMIQLKKAQLDDADAQSSLVEITEEIKNAKTDEDARNLRVHIVDSIYSGLRDYQRGNSNSV